MRWASLTLLLIIWTVASLLPAVVPPESVWQVLVGAVFTIAGALLLRAVDKDMFDPVTA